MQNLERFTWAYQKYLEQQNLREDDLRQQLLQTMQQYFDQTDNFGIQNEMFDQMRHLVTAGMTREQIWQQIELGRNEYASQLIDLVTAEVQSDDQSVSGSERSISDVPLEPAEVSEEALSELSEIDIEDDQEIDLNAHPGQAEQQEQVDFYDDEEMEQFANGEVDEEFDLTQDMSEDDGNITYADFFDPPKKFRQVDAQTDSEVDAEVESEPQVEPTMQELDLFDNQDEDQNEEQQTSHQKKQQRLQKQIEQLEKTNIETKPWNLLGEVKSGQRPDNSLLEHTVEFDHASKPVPVITDEVTNTLEDIIKQRIKESLFDSVERMAEPVDDRKPKERLEVDETKNAKSLAQIYEDDYAKSQKQHQEEQQSKLQRLDAKLSQEPTPEHQEIMQLYEDLSYTLNSLTSYHFVPKPHGQHELLIKSTPAIEMEEIIPLGVSDQQVLAPQEVYNKSGVSNIKTTEELSKQDKNRLRKLKKRRQRTFKKKESTMDKLKKSGTQVKIIGK